MIDPCGLVMDFLQEQKYGTKVRTYYSQVRIREDPEWIVTIRWYTAPPGAAAFPGVHAFGSLVWDRFTDAEPPTGLGAVSYDFSQHAPDAPPPGVTGTGTPTPLSWFLDGVPAGVVGPYPNGPCVPQGETWTIPWVGVVGGPMGTATTPLAGLQVAQYSLRACLNQWQVLLFTNDVTPGSGTQYTDLRETYFSGYNRQSPLFSTTQQQADGSSVASSAPLAWVFGGGPPVSVYGWALIDLGSQQVIALARLTGAPQILAHPGDRVFLQGFTFQLSPPGGGMPVDSFNGRTGNVVLTSADVLAALGYTPLSSVGIGTPVTSGTPNALLYVDPTGKLGDSPSLTYDGTHLLAPAEILGQGEGTLALTAGTVRGPNPATVGIGSANVAGVPAYLIGGGSTGQGAGGAVHIQVTNSSPTSGSTPNPPADGIVIQDGGAAGPGVVLAPSSGAVTAGNKGVSPVYLSTTGGVPVFQVSDTNNAGPTIAFDLVHTLTSGAAANGIGAAFTFTVQQWQGATTQYIAAQLIGGWSTVGTSVTTQRGRLQLFAAAGFHLVEFFRGTGISASAVGISFFGGATDAGKQTGDVAQALLAYNLVASPYYSAAGVGGPGITSRLAQVGGTSTATTDWALGSGWGAHATVTAVSGNDNRGTVTVQTSPLDTPASFPTVTLTYKDGAWLPTSYAVASMDSGSTGPLAAVCTATTLTTLTLAYAGTPPPGGSTYTFSYQVEG